MTKAELEKEAEEKYIERLKQNGIKTKYRNQTYNDGYIDGAETREKQIQALGERCLQLQKDKGNLTDKIRKLNIRFDKIIKENARLKTDYEVLSCSVGDFDELQNKLEKEQRKNNGLEEQLTHAKDLLKRCYDTYVYEACIRREIEQLLNEVK